MTLQSRVPLGVPASVLVSRAAEGTPCLGPPGAWLEGQSPPYCLLQAVGREPSGDKACRRRWATAGHIRRCQGSRAMQTPGLLPLMVLGGRHRPEGAHNGVPRLAESKSCWRARMRKASTSSHTECRGDLPRARRKKVKQRRHSTRSSGGGGMEACTPAASTV